MKREWEVEELVETFTLTADERVWVSGKADYNQLGLAVLLKFFQQEGRFPTRLAEVPESVVRYIGQQLHIVTERYNTYDLTGRTAERDRREVRDRVGFREATVADAEQFSTWLTTQSILNYDQDIHGLKTLAYQYFRDHHLEPPSSDRIDRSIRSALYQYELALFAAIEAQLPAKARLLLDNLVADADSEVMQWSPLAILKTDPSSLGVKAVLKEVAKLEQL